MMTCTFKVWCAYDQAHRPLFQFRTDDVADFQNLFLTIPHKPSAGDTILVEFEGDGETRVKNLTEADLLYIVRGAKYAAVRKAYKQIKKINKAYGGTNQRRER